MYCADVMQKRSGEIISSRSASFLMHQRQVYGCERGDGVGVGSKRSGARGKVRRRTAQTGSRAVIVSQVS